MLEGFGALGALLGLSWALLGALETLKRSQVVPKTLQDAPKTLQETFLRVPGEISGGFW